jgi:hypothetical protein
MAGTVAPNMVTDGLVLYLDAANNKSYPGSGTTWVDIVAENNLTLVNGPTFNGGNGGSIVFDGADDRVSRTTSINTGQNFTINAWIYPTLLGTTRRAVAASSYNYTSISGWFFSTGGGINNSFFISVGNDNAYRIAAANTLSLNQWVYISAVCQNGGELINLYKNGIETSYALTSLSTNTLTYTYPQFNVGFRDVGGTTDPYTGNISVVQIYNRALSATEILQNYNTTKTRFGL